MFMESVLNTRYRNDVASKWIERLTLHIMKIKNKNKKKNEFNAYLDIHFDLFIYFRHSRIASLVSSI